MLTLHQLQALVAVADCESFAEAAVRLGTSQPNVSAAILSAERQLGRTLFARRPVAPTSDCQVILPDARRIVGEAARLEEKLNLLATTPGIFRLAVPTTLRLAYGQEMLAGWKQRFPQLEVALLEGEDDEIRQWLRTGFIDAGVLINPAPSDLSGAAIQVCEDAFEGIIQDDHPLAGQTTIDLDDLLDDQIVLSDSGCRSEVESLCRATRSTFEPQLLVRDMSSLLSLVKSGTMVTILPSICERILPAGVQPIRLRPNVPRHLIATVRPNLPTPYEHLFNELIEGLRDVGLDPRRWKQSETQFM